MVFDSYYYLFLFLPIAFILYQFVRETRYHNIALCTASMIFYAYGQLIYLSLLIFISIQDYYIADILHRTVNETMRKLLVVLSVFSNLFILAIFKYTDWFIGIINDYSKYVPINGRTLPIIPHLNLILPIGISFYVFHTISYTVDAYRRIVIPKKNIIDYMTFVSFFPLLVAGPIQRARDLLPQISQIRARPSYRAIEYSIFLILYGLTKKIVFADNLGKLIDHCRSTLNNPDAVSVPGSGLVLALAFTFQIYADFSAYTDIATGSARLFNLKLTRNFFTPYFSGSPSEFWQRWHICLSSWLRDYLYIPLGGNRSGKYKLYFNLMVTMILGGIWHGAGVFFLFWGIYHGLLLSVYRLFPLQTYLKKYLGTLGRIISISLMFMFTVFGWVLFFVKTPQEFHSITHNIVNLIAHPLSVNATSKVFFYGLMLYIVPLIITDSLGFARKRQFVELYPAYSTTVKVLLYVLMFYLMIFFGRREGYAFIYFQF